MASPKFRNSCMSKLNNRGQSTGQACQTLKLWKEAPNDGTKDNEISLRKKVLTDFLRARLCIRRSGIANDQFRRDSINGYDSRSRERPNDVVEAS